jgi:transposase InsO family protein
MEHPRSPNLTRQQINLFRKLYYDTRRPTALTSVKRIFEAAKKASPQTTLSDVREFLGGERAYVIHKPTRRQFPRSKIYASMKNDLWEADLTEVQKLARYNDKVRYLLTVVDVFSKVAYVEPLLSKKGEQVAKAFARVLRKAHPLNLRTDQGSEFKSKFFRNLLSQYQINHYMTNEGDIKTGVAERFNRTIKSRIYKLMTFKRSSRYLDDLENLVRGYNSSFHRSIGMPPRDVTETNSRTVWDRLFGQGRKNTRTHTPKFRVGDSVLITRDKDIYGRGYTPNWRSEIFSVTHRFNHYPYRYKIADSDGEVLLGSFYEPELQIIDQSRLQL